MPLSKDMIAQIVLGVRAEGEGYADRLRQELERLRNELQASIAAFAAGNATYAEHGRQYVALGRSINQLEQQLKAATEEVVRADPEFQRLQATLGAMEQRVAQEASQAIALSRQSTTAAVASWRERVDAARQGQADLAAVRAALGAMNQRDAQEAAEAAALARQTTNASASSWRQRVGDAQQAEADLAAVHAALGQMEQRDAQNAREAAALAAQSTRAAVEQLHVSQQLAEAKRREAEASRQLADEMARDNARINQFLEKHAQEVQKTADQVAQAAIKEGEEFARVGEQHEAWLSKTESDEEKAALARIQSHDKAAAAVGAASAKINQFLDSEGRAAEEAAQRQIAADIKLGDELVQATEKHEKMRQQWAADEVAQRQAANAAAGTAREIDHLNDVIREEAQAQAQATTATQAGANQQAVLSRMTYTQVAAMKPHIEALKAQAAATKGVASANRAAGSSAVGAGRRFGAYTTIIQQAGYGLGDLAQTSGSLGQKLMSITNNVQFAAASFGPAGVAVGLFSVAIASAVQNWDMLSASLGRGGIPTDTIAGIDLAAKGLESINKEIEEIRKHPTVDLVTRFTLIGLQEQRDAIAKARKEVEELKAITEGGSKEDRERASGFKEAVGESGGKLAIDELLTRLKEKADSEGVALDNNQIKEQLKKAGLVDRSDKRSWGQTLNEMLGDPGQGRKIDAGKLAAIGDVFGIQFDAQAMQRRLDTDGASMEKQIGEAIRARKHLMTETGDLLTPEAMARKLTVQAGEKGDKGAVDEIKKTLGPASPFAQAIQATSPEGKKAAREADELADLQFKELEEQTAEMKRVREANQRKRQAAANETTREFLASQKGGDLVRSAADQMHELQKAGGERGPGGVVKPMTPEEIRLQVQGWLQVELTKALQAKGVSDPKGVSAASITMTNQAQAQLAKEQKEAGQAADERARDLARGKQAGLETELEGAVAGRIAGGEDRGAIAAGLKGQIGQRLAGPGKAVSPEMDAAAGIILDRVMEKVFGMVASQGGGLSQADAAKGVLKDLQGKAAQKGLQLQGREDSLERKMQRNMIEQGLMMNFGANRAQAAKIAPHVQQMAEQGFDLDFAAMQAVQRYMEGMNRQAGVAPAGRAARNGRRSAAPSGFRSVGPSANPGASADVGHAVAPIAQTQGQMLGLVGGVQQAQAALMQTQRQLQARIQAMNTGQQQLNGQIAKQQDWRPSLLQRFT